MVPFWWLLFLTTTVVQAQIPCSLQLDCSSGSFITNVKDACTDPSRKNCEQCKDCGSYRTTWPCFSGRRAADPSRCIDLDAFVDFRNHRCKQNEYFDYQLADAKAWNAGTPPHLSIFAVHHISLMEMVTAGDLLVLSPDSLKYAVAQPNKFVHIYDN